MNNPHHNLSIPSIPLLKFENPVTIESIFRELLLGTKIILDDQTRMDLHSSGDLKLLEQELLRHAQRICSSETPEGGLTVWLEGLNYSPSAIINQYLAPPSWPQMSPQQLQSLKTLDSNWRFLANWKREFAWLATSRPAEWKIHPDPLRVPRMLRSAQQKGWKLHDGVKVITPTSDPDDIIIALNAEAYEYYLDVLFHGGCGDRYNRGGSVHIAVHIDPESRKLVCRDPDCFTFQLGNPPGMNVQLQWSPTCQHVQDFMKDPMAIAAYELFGSDSPNKEITGHRSGVDVPVLSGITDLRLLFHVSEGEMRITHAYDSNETIEVRMKSDFGDTLQMAINTVLDKYRTSGLFASTTIDMTDLCLFGSRHRGASYTWMRNSVLNGAFESPALRDLYETERLADAISYNETGMCWVCKFAGERNVPLYR